MDRGGRARPPCGADRGGRGRSGAALNRGELYDAELSVGRHPVVIVTRDRAIPYLSNVCVALVTSRTRGVPTEVAVGPAHGLARESVVNCDNLFTVKKGDLGPRRGALGPLELRRLRTALRIALDLD